MPRAWDDPPGKGEFPDMRELFKKNEKIALALSGGLKSGYLLCQAVAAKARVGAYYVKTPFQPQFELDDALELTLRLGVELRVLPVDILEDETVGKNTKRRCYYCKKKMFSALCRQAEEDGYPVVAEGSGAEGGAQDPERKALRELCVRSPLREKGLTREEVVRLAQEDGLFLWDKPAYDCLACGIAPGEPLVPEALEAVERGEEALRARGFSGARVELLHGWGRIRLPQEQMNRLVREREDVCRALGKLYDGVALELTAADGPAGRQA